jgi:nicotinate-nucleotide pyrophosphorylase (carboxylating)
LLLLRLTWGDLDPAYLRRLAETAREEDLNGLGLRIKPAHPGDATTASVTATAPRQSSAELVAREPLTACGLGFIPLILSVYGGRATAHLRVKDGAALPAGGVLATLHGDPRTLLSAERIILNFIQRLSGIATHTRRHVAALGGGRTRLLDTRKTTPGLPVEIEVDRLAQIPAALAAGADVILLDNFTVPQLRRAVALIGGRAFTEASGGISLSTLPRLAPLGLDFASTGALVHHSVWVDIGLDWRE